MTLVGAPLRMPRPADATVLWRVRDPHTTLTAVCYAWPGRRHLLFRIEVDGAPVARLARRCVTSLETLLGVAEDFRTAGWKELTI